MPTLEYVVVGTLLVSVLIIAGIEFVTFFVKRAAKLAGAGRVLIRDLGAFARIIEVVLIAFTITRLSGLSSDFTTLTLSGIGALALSLALQTTLSNIISGILLLSDGVIHLGDVIEYSSVKGTVVRIALRNIWLKTDSGSIAVVSNTSLSNGPLVNHTAIERLKKKYAID
ncbi:MAG: mechanosensitive ion channel domain-containing protein [Nitrososphaerales archaeon]|jgi:small conductance mechanosensitive channel